MPSERDPQAFSMAARMKPQLRRPCVGGRAEEQLVWAVIRGEWRILIAVNHDNRRFVQGAFCPQRFAKRHVSFMKPWSCGGRIYPEQRHENAFYYM
jgi:hypothetical protein